MDQVIVGVVGFALGMCATAIGALVEDAWRLSVEKAVEERLEKRVQDYVSVQRVNHGVFD